MAMRPLSLVRRCCLPAGLLLLVGIAIQPIARTQAERQDATENVSAQGNSASNQDEPEFTAQQLEFFESRIRPILADRCYHCHGPNKQESGLRVDSRAALLAGGDSGPAVVPGKPNEGYFVDAIRYGDIYQMPKDGRLPQNQIDDLVAWVEMGAPWPEEKAPAATISPEEEFNLAERAKHWSFLPLNESTRPDVQDVNWPRNWIDHFVLARLESADIQPSPEADRATWLRRVTFDLVGLPPTPEELEDFLADDSPQAYERVVDRLLESPQYGERWARHWLDLVRYADTAGHEFDYDIPLAYRYRDYVIRAFNQDVPYDQFVREHIAGDLLPQPRRSAAGENESVQATGFWWLGEGKHSPVDIRGEEADRMDNQLDVFGKTFLGLTIACARCHDHKFDAISTRDYYALAGFLQSSRYHEAAVDSPSRREEAVLAIAELLPQRDRLLSQQLQVNISKDEFVRGLMAVRAAVVLNADERVESELAAMDEEALKPWLDQKLSPDDARRWAASAKVFGLETEELTKWRNELIAASRQAEHPLRAWSAVALDKQPQKSGLDGLRPFSERWQRFADRKQTLETKANDEFEQHEVYADFRDGVPADWFTTDGAFGPASRVESGPVWSAGAPARLIPAGVVHSGRVSHRLQGTLRSPTFEIRSPKILYRIAGRGTKLNLIINGFQRIRDPIYGGLTIGLNHDELRWHAQDVSKWIGHRAYIEVIDHGNGWAALDQVLFGERPPQESELTPTATALHAIAPTDVESLAAAIADQLSQSSDEAELVWLANSGLIANKDGVLEETQAGQLQSLETQRQKYEAQLRYGTRALAMADGNGVDEFVFLRGNHKTPGDLVHRRFLEAFENQPADYPGSGRLELAERMTHESRDLLARVTVNRLWLHHFGRGLAATPDNLGRLGTEPSHPGLLDALASEFVRGGWRLKPLHKAMVLTATYRQSSQTRPEVQAADPNNLLWHRMPVRRLEAEAIRDAALAISRRRDLENMYGPSVPTHLTPFMQGRGRPGNSGPLDGNGRRSIYLSVRRNFLSPFLTAFDFPTPFSTMGRRDRSNVPAQSLAMSNDPFVLAEAERWAKLVIASLPDARAADETTNRGVTEKRLRMMYAKALTREPTQQEIATFADYLQTQSAAGTGELDRWTEVAHAVMNMKEFIYVR